jgi:hypothetical protein
MKNLIIILLLASLSNVVSANVSSDITDLKAQQFVADMVKAYGYSCPKVKSLIELTWERGYRLSCWRGDGGVYVYKLVDKGGKLEVQLVR